MTDALVSVYSGTGVTASFNGNAVNLPKAGFPRRGLKLRAIVQNVSGTTPTLTLKVQTTRNGGTNWLDRAFFVNTQNATTDAISAAGEYYVEFWDNDSVNETTPLQFRVVGTIAGTTPSFDIAVDLVVSILG